MFKTKTVGRGGLGFLRRSNGDSAAPSIKCTAVPCSGGVQISTLFNALQVQISSLLCSMHDTISHNPAQMVTTSTSPHDTTLCEKTAVEETVLNCVLSNISSIAVTSCTQMP